MAPCLPAYSTTAHALHEVPSAFILTSSSLTSATSTECVHHSRHVLEAATHCEEITKIPVLKELTLVGVDSLKNKIRERSMQRDCVCATVLDGVGSEGLAKKVTLEQRPKGGEGGSHLLSWDRTVQAEVIASAKALRQKVPGFWEEPQGWSGVSNGESGEEGSGTKGRITDLKRPGGS